MKSFRVAVGLLVAAGLSSAMCEVATAAMARPAWRQRQNYQAPAAIASPASQTRSTGNYSRNAYPSSRSGWNASNTWYNVPSYGNYAPPPYATSRAAFYQVGPVPALGGARSLPGWGGAR
jgi:hypothetical protein